MNWALSMKPERTKTWLDEAIRRAFTPGSYALMLLPPTTAVGASKKESKTRYGWNKCLHDGFNPVVLSGPVNYIHPEEFTEQFYDDLYTPSGNAAPTPVIQYSQNQPQYITTTHPQQLETLNTRGPVWTQPQTTIPPDAEENPWTTVDRSHPPSRAATPGPSRKRSRSPIRSAKRASNTWTLRFPKGKSPTKDEQYNGPTLDTFQIISKVKALAEENKKHFTFRPLTCKWTNAGNISITFSDDSKPESIKKAAVSITNRINHSVFGCTFVQASLWSKVALSNVPIWFVPTNEDEDMLVPKDGEGNIIQVPWSQDQLYAEFKENAVVKNLQLQLPPSWCKNPKSFDPSKEWVGTFAVVFEDPDGSIANMIVETPIYMFGNTATVRHWKERPNLNMCPCCLNFGPTHDKCNQRCLLCAAPDHTAENHNTHCGACLGTHSDIRVKMDDFVCPHLHCAHCSAAHPADSESCTKRNEKVIQAQGSVVGQDNRLEGRLSRKHQPYSRKAKGKEKADRPTLLDCLEPPPRPDPTLPLLDPIPRIPEHERAPTDFAHHSQKHDLQFFINFPPN